MTLTEHSETMTSPFDRLDRMSAVWEREKHLLSDELKTFLCSAVQTAMETWRGHAAPTARSIIQETVLPTCNHHWTKVNATDSYCNLCGMTYRIMPVVPFPAGAKSGVNITLPTTSPFVWNWNQQ